MRCAYAGTTSCAAHQRGRCDGCNGGTHGPRPTVHVTLPTCSSCNAPWAVMLTLLASAVLFVRISCRCWCTTPRTSRLCARSSSQTRLFPAPQPTVTSPTSGPLERSTCVLAGLLLNERTECVRVSVCVCVCVWVGVTERERNARMHTPMSACVDRP